MSGIESQAAFYRGYLAEDRGLTPHVGALATIVALWSLVYLVGCFAPPAKQPMGPAQWSAPVARGESALTPGRARPNLPHG